MADGRAGKGVTAPRDTRTARFLEGFRQRLGTVMVITSLVLLIVVSVVAIVAATSSERGETTRLVFAAVVPLVGTWVGTVLAYYFGRENFESAATQTRETVEQALGTPPARVVSDEMLPRDRMVAPPGFADEAAARAMALRDVEALMTARGVNRTPLLTDGDVAMFVIHESAILRFAMNASVTSPDFGDRTVGDLLDDTVASASATAFEVVGPTATIADARAKVKTSSNCKDVFVTDTGARDGKVIGWLTNSDLARLP
jgi:hypothetical protein